MANLNLSYTNYNLRDCCVGIVKNILEVDPLKTALECEQGSEKWKKERLYRLTGNLLVL